MSALNMGGLTGLQFVMSGWLQKIATGGTPRKLTAGLSIMGDYTYSYTPPYLYASLVKPTHRLFKRGRCLVCASILFGAGRGGDRDLVRWRRSFRPRLLRVGANHDPAASARRYVAARGK